MVLELEDLFQKNGYSEKDFRLDNDPLREAIKPIKSTITIEELIKEQNYKGTDWNKLNAIAENMAIQEPIEILLAQLKD